MKKPTKIIFSFDTEDFTSDRASDAIVTLAHICQSEGVRAHFAVVGLVARELIAHRRFDVIDALSPHIIGTHTYGHTLHPDICELTDEYAFEKAYLQAAMSECEGIGMLRAAFGRDHILYACPPGNSKSYAAMYLYADLGIPFYCDTCVTDAEQSDLYYCNLRQIAYSVGMEGLFFPSDAPSIAETLDKLAQKEQAIIYCHPNMMLFSRFWDGVNYKGENKHPYGQWEACPARAPEETRRFYDGFRSLIKAIKADSRFEITDLEALRAAEAPRGVVTPAHMPALRAALLKKLGPVNAPFSLSVADIFQAAVRFLRGETEYVPGKVYGFLDAPEGIDMPVTVTRAKVIEAARELDLTGFLPVTIDVDGVRLGPADFLYAALEVLCTTPVTKRIRLMPRPQLNAMEGFDELHSFQLRGTWMHAPTLEDNYLSDRLRWQAWTLRYGD